LLAVVYLVLRVLYILMYLANQANVRSLVWGLALA